jgi:hypothetical protein
MFLSTPADIVLFIVTLVLLVALLVWGCCFCGLPRLGCYLVTCCHCGPCRWFRDNGCSCCCCSACDIESDV